MGVGGVGLRRSWRRSESGCLLFFFLSVTVNFFSSRCKVVFMDTDALPARDSRVGDLVQNEMEAELVCQIVGALVRSGVQEEQIGVLSLYRQQVKLLGHVLNGDGGVKKEDEKDKRKGIEILTADRSQGRDKDCVIISMVRSNDTGNVGHSFALAYGVIAYASFYFRLATL